MSEPTEAEQIQIANKFLLNAPPGEFMEVVTDVRALLPRESMLNETAPATFKEYNQDQMIQVDAPDGSHKFLLCKYAEVAPNQYIDHAGGQVATFDHIKQTISGTRSIGGSDVDPASEPLRAALQKAVEQYVNDQYPFGTGGVYSGKENCLYVCITSTRFNPQNFWNGRWRSVWTVPLAKSGNVTLSGRIRLQVHYYEDGNVQLHTDTAKKVTMTAAADPAAMSQAIIKAIVKAEQTFHTALDASYAVMGETTCKALRRALPITGQRINWTLIHTYRLGQDVQGGSAAK